MKKLLICTIIAFILSNCEIKTRETKADRNEVPPSQSNKSYNIWSKDRYYNIDNIVYFKDGIEYHIYKYDGYDKGGIFVVNHTKELLEVELLKKQLNK